MNSIAAENRELDALDINQPKESPPSSEEPGTGLILGTDFRHAVEFSKSGRARTPGPKAFVSRRSLVVHRTTARPRRVCPLAPDGVSRGAERKLRRFGGRCQTGSRVTPDTRPPRLRHLPDTRRGGPGQASGPAFGQCTPAMLRFPLRRTSQPPGSQSEAAGGASASATRALLT